MEGKYKHPQDEKKVRFRVNLLGTKKEGRMWTLVITIIAFITSVLFSIASTETLKLTNNYIAFLILFIIIVINIVFDIIGTAVTAADEAPFHAMASRKLYGARQSIRLIRNADKVSNLCNDVVGDICGIISGTAGAYIIYRITGDASGSEVSVASLSITGVIASLTVGGKALGKTIAIANSNFIIYKVGVIIKFLFGRINLSSAHSKRRAKR